MSDALAIFKQQQVPQKYDDSSFKDMSKSGDWLPRVQLYGSNSKEVKAGKFPMAHYGLVNGKNIDDMGPQFDCVPIAWRPKAMRIGNEGIDSYYDDKSDQFIKVKAESEIKDSGCMYGPEFLIWLPVQKTFATIYFNNPTMRRESPNMRALLAQGTTCKVQYIEKGKYSWHGPVVVPCSTPITEAPDAETFQKELTKFNSPASSTTETVDAPANDRAR